MDYMTSAEFAAKHGITSRMVAYYCKNNQISGAIKKGKTWLIPINAKKPFDRRKHVRQNQEDTIIPSINGNINELDIATFNNRYRVQEVNDFIGVTREGIRYYEKLGLIQSTRDEENNYRTFGGYDIFHLMAIDFYHKRGFSNQEIKELFQITNPNGLLCPIEKKEQELIESIKMYQKNLQKLQATKQYILSLNETYNVFTIAFLPLYEVKSTFSSFTAFYEYQEKVLNAKNFSNDDILSNLIRILYFDDNGYTGSQMSIIEKSNMQTTNISCAHIRVSANNDDEILAEKMLKKSKIWASENNIQLEGTVYIFIQLVLFGTTIEHSYYDIYVPIK